MHVKHHIIVKETLKQALTDVVDGFLHAHDPHGRDVLHECSRGVVAVESDHELVM